MDNKVELYKENNSLQKHDVAVCLREFGGRIKWRGSARAVDLGCGDGGATAGLLRPFLPSDLVQLVGCDVSARMVAHANAHHGDARTSFLQLDLEAPLPPQMKGIFDHAFSFYTLHWIWDQKCAFTNIYEMLAPGGDCLVMFLAHHPWVKMLKGQSAYPAWRALMPMNEFRAMVYQDTQEPEVEIRRLMENIGFKNVHVETKVMSYVFNTVDMYLNALLAVHPFDIPRELCDRFKHDNLRVIREMRLPDFRLEEAGGPGQGRVHTEYTMLFVSAEK